MSDVKNYDLDYFIQKFEAIPEEQWCQILCTNSDDQHCALGHCGAKTIYDDAVPEASALKKLVLRLSPTQAPIWRANDTPRRFAATTPRNGVLNYLKAIKKFYE